MKREQFFMRLGIILIVINISIYITSFFLPGENSFNPLLGIFLGGFIIFISWIYKKNNNKTD